MAWPVAAAALALDAMLGWPAWLYRRIGHPVGGFARVIAACAARMNGSERSPLARRLGGVATVALLLALSGGGGWLIQRTLYQMPGRWAWPAVALTAFPGLAARSLHEHVRPVAEALAAGDLPRARRRVGMIVGRDTAALDEPAIARAAIESLAESFCDGVTAPLFWLMMLGLPGVWAYKAINTADSLIGHKDAPWGDFGWAAARTDDVANFLPARLAGILLCLAAGGGWRTLWRDCRRHASPNAGWPEAAMAGALGIRLAGPVSYDGIVAIKPWLGEGGVADLAALRRALRIYHRAWGLLLVAAMLWAIMEGLA